MMERLFQLKQHGVSAPKEMLCGVTTFLTMSYILFVNPSIAAEAGMPVAGAFAATALTAAVCSLLTGLVANTPFAMAPGMGLNTLIIYSVCLGLGFHWKEGLALTFISGLLHALLMLSPLRKSMVNAIPQHLKLATAAGLGLFIAYLGIKNAGFLMFTTPVGQYEIMETGAIISNSFVTPGIARSLSTHQALSLGGLLIMLVLLAMGAKTREDYAAIPVGVITITFIGIPLNITELHGINLIDFTPLTALGNVFMSFFDQPGLGSLFADPGRALLAVLACLMVLLTNIVDSISTIIGIGQVPDALIFDGKEMDAFRRKGCKSKLDKTLICTSLGGGLAALMGTTPCTTFIESITGILSGGRTGLTACVTGLMFLGCLPLANFFNSIPSAAGAPALIIAGSFMLPLVHRIDWRNFEESCPSFLTLLFLPVPGSIFGGVIAGVMGHIIIQIFMGKWRSVHPLLYAASILFIVILLAGGPNI